MEIVMWVVRVAATLFVGYGGVLCLSQQLLVNTRQPLRRDRGTRQGRFVGELEPEVRQGFGKGVLTYLSS